MTTADMAKLLGRKGELKTEGLSIPVEIEDARESFGRTDVLVRPVGGRGTTWVSLERVWLNDEEATTS